MAVSGQRFVVAMLFAAIWRQCTGSQYMMKEADTNHDGFVSLKEVQGFVEEQAIRQVQSMPESVDIAYLNRGKALFASMRQNLEQAFQSSDSDGDGVLSAEEALHFDELMQDSVSRAEASL
eukprot:TRINITY_DN58878_c0_g1_i1.p1 TRINITY_DN58878_c0_g1~~TRINITY_DN58878_c0_g1_i1.p1  ORF type:complete len:121 (+),score=23.50 TRINITY_DN58878_c0_g1_i1:87-449(+)